MEYLIPANTKRGQLIFSIFRPIDLIIFAVGLSITLILLAFFPTSDIGLLIYHNMLVLLIEMYNFLSSNQKLIWRGWCIDYGRNKKTK